MRESDVWLLLFAAALGFTSNVQNAAATADLAFDEFVKRFDKLNWKKFGLPIGRTGGDLTDFVPPGLTVPPKPGPPPSPPPTPVVP